MSTHRVCCCDCTTCCSEVAYRNGTPTVPDVITIGKARGQVYTFEGTRTRRYINPFLPSQVDRDASIVGIVGVSPQSGRAPTIAEVTDDYNLDDFDTVNAFATYEAPPGSGVYWRRFIAYTETDPDSLGVGIPTIGSASGTIYGFRLTFPIEGSSQSSGSPPSFEISNSGTRRRQRSTYVVYFRDPSGAETSRQTDETITTLDLAHAWRYLPPSYLGDGSEFECEEI